MARSPSEEEFTSEVELEPAQDSTSDCDSVFLSPWEELLYLLNEAQELNLFGDLDSSDGKAGLSALRERHQRLGPADRFAVGVSVFSVAILVFIALTRFLRAVRNRFMAFKNRHAMRKAGIHSAGFSNAIKAEKEATPSSMVSPENPESEQPISDQSGNSERTSDNLKEKEQPSQQEIKHVSMKQRPPQRMSKIIGRRAAIRGPPTALLLATNPNLRKEERKLRALEDALFLMELERPRDPGPEEFVLGVLSRVLDIHRLGRYSDA